MLKWLTITLIAVVAFITVLLGLGYLLKEHEIETTQLKQQLDQQRVQQKAREERKQQKFKPSVERSLVTLITTSKTLPKQTPSSLKQKILIENLTCSSKKQCVLIDIHFVDVSCTFAINTIGASLLAKASDELTEAGRCPSYPENSQLSCQSNLCTFGSINN